jgi:hypothetical protein
VEGHGAEKGPSHAYMYTRMFCECIFVI